MAGDWIKMRAELFTHPRFLALSRSLVYGEDHGILLYGCAADALPINVFPPASRNVTEAALRCVTEEALRAVTMCALLKVWCSVNAHCKVSNNDAVCEGIDLLDLDTIAGFSGFGKAMEGCGWVKEDEARNLLVFPNFLEFNEPACLRRKTPLTGAERAARHRAAKASLEASKSRVTKVTKSNAREEKRREEVLRVSPDGETLANGHPEPRPRNDLWDVLCELFSLSPKAKPECSRLGKVVRDLGLKGATPADVRIRFERYRRAWPDISCTPEALFKHWDWFGQERAEEDHRSMLDRFFGTGNGK